MVHLTSSDCPTEENSLVTGAKKVWESRQLLLFLTVVGMCCVTLLYLLTHVGPASAVFTKLLWGHLTLQMCPFLPANQKEMRFLAQTDSFLRDFHKQPEVRFYECDLEYPMRAAVEALQGSARSLLFLALYDCAASCALLWAECISSL